VVCGSRLAPAPQHAAAATLLSPTSDTETLFGFDHREIALTGGGFAGYQYQVGWMVIGAEADAAAKNLDSSGTAAVVANATYTGNSPGQTESAGRSEFFNGTVRQNWDASARLRAGWLLTPSILLYGTGGVALGSIDSAFNYSATAVYNQNGNPPYHAYDVRRGELERAAHRLDRRCGIGNCARPELEVPGRISLHGFRTIHEGHLAVARKLQFGVAEYGPFRGRSRRQREFPHVALGCRV
jgi:hypothetical protein